MIWHDWDSTKPQVSPDFDALALLAVLGRFRFWCCQSVAKSAISELANRSSAAERSIAKNAIVYACPAVVVCSVR